MTPLPDQAHLDIVRAALWRGRQYGHAAVMVGAGFSLQAKPTSVAVPPFPDWKQLAGRLVDALYPEHSCAPSDRANAMAQAASASGVLRLAEEYKAAFGPDAPSQFLLSQIPDANYNPGPLHRSLLRLPWSDVLTTNYDTLLERAAVGLVDRKYDVVRTMSDIPRAARPRIVKLHGSFPSTRPFIFTEEDFRTYPRLFGAFVNLAQQAIMENVFCLLGFSGDDPNFLYWSGWVRDHLGESAPQIYLCGLLNLTTARRNLLHDRNVVPVDLSPLFPREQWPDEQIRHAKALEWLLLSLEAGEPPTLLRWPSRVIPTRTPRSAGVPAIIEPEYPQLVAESVEPRSAQYSPAEFDQLLTSWKANRELYPGWLVAPSTSREATWRCTERWIWPILEALPSMPIERQLRVLFELNWRLEICLMPLWREISTSIALTLGQINPFPDVLQMPQATLKPEQDNIDVLDWRFLRHAWVELSFALLRFAREVQDSQEFDRWVSSLTALRATEPDCQSRLSYEHCLFTLARMDHATVRRWLDEWVVKEEDPIWLVRRAAVLAEIGEVREAEDLADGALRTIRDKIRPTVDDFPMLSREGWAMLLVNALKSGRAFVSNQEGPDFRGRWEELTAYRCNPDSDLRLLEAELKQPPPPEQSPESRVIGFDPGDVRTNFRLGSEGLWSRLRPALQRIRLVDHVAYPPRCGMATLGQEALTKAARWLEPYCPERTMSILLRAAGVTTIEGFFTRHRVAALSSDLTASLHGMVTNALSHALEALPAASARSQSELRHVAVNQAEVAIELLSRVVMRLPDPTMAQELDRAIRFYRVEAFSQEPPLALALGRFFGRLCLGSPKRALGDRLLELASLPIPAVDGFQVPNLDCWPEPAETLPDVPAPRRADHEDRWKHTIQWLLGVTANGEPDPRGRAIVRLRKLAEYEVLSEAEKNQFAQALWKVRDDNTGLPTCTGPHDVALLWLPEPSPGMARNALKTYYLRAEIRPPGRRITDSSGKVSHSFTITGDPAELMKAIVKATAQIGPPISSRAAERIDWTVDEARLILGKITAWWAAEDKALCLATQDFPMAITQLRARIEWALEVLRVVVMPRCSPSDPMGPRLEKLVGEIEPCGIPIDPILPALLRISPGTHGDVVRRIRRGLVSSDEQRADAAIRGLYSWLCSVKPMQIPPPPADLLHEIGHIISGRRQPALRSALRYAADLARLLPGCLDATFVDSACVGLQYLLEETRYRESDEPSQIPYADVPDYRVRAARLAAALANTAHADQPVLQPWLEAAKGDPLPEVRRIVDQS